MTKQDKINLTIASVLLAIALIMETIFQQIEQIK